MCSINFAIIISAFNYSENGEIMKVRRNNCFHDSSSATYFFKKWRQGQFH